jgi:Zn ribbon nucleic-acid-binding protein
MHLDLPRDLSEFDVPVTISLESDISLEGGCGTAGVRSVFGHPDSSRPCVSCARRCDDTDALWKSARLPRVSCLECVFSKRRSTTQGPSDKRANPGHYVFLTTWYCKDVLGSRSFLLD